MSRWLNFEGQNALVVGGTSGINLGIAEAFAEQGASVAVASRSPAKVDAALQRLAAFGVRTCGFAADVRDPAALESGLSTVADALGPIDTLVVGQAGNFPAAAMKLSPNGFKSVVDIDLLGSFNVIRLAHNHLRPGKANIIAISAPQATIPMAFQAHVCAAKAGVEMLVRVLAVELGPGQVRVNAIIPGPIEDTEGMARLAPTPEAREGARRSVPMQRYGTAREVANCAMFLASPLAAYISGAIIPVDGGWSAAGAGVGAAMSLGEIA
jgi:NAD(P)-dependent dehydrogenase (short-subunit alcohol dehydrogenase family)